MFDQVNALLPQFSHLNVARLCWIFLRLLYSLLWLETANHTQTISSIKYWGLISYARENFDSVKEPKTADMTVLLSLLPNTIIAFLLSRNWNWNWNCSRRYVGQSLLNILNIVTNKCLFLLSSKFDHSEEFSTSDDPSGKVVEKPLCGWATS